MNHQQLYNLYSSNCFKLILFYLCCCYTNNALAQPASIKYIHYTRHNFLATNQVNWIMQDKKKFMWFATSNGIQRFDGNRWVWLTQQTNSATSLPDNDVSSMLQDRQERIWVLTSSGICLLNANSLAFTPVNIVWSAAHKTRTFRSLLALPDGHIWFTVAGGGLYYYNEPTREFVIADGIIPASPWSIEQIAFDARHQQYYLGTDKGIVIYDMSAKQFYDAGYNPRGLTFLKMPAARKTNTSIYLNDSAQLWFSSFTEQNCYDIKKDRIIFCDSTSKVWGILGYTTDCSGTTWSYGAGISKMNLASGKVEPIEQTPDQLYGIKFQNAGYFFEDNEHTYWLATNNGVFIYNRFRQQFVQHPIKSYATGELFEHINVWGFVELADSSIVALTTRGEGLYYFDKNFHQLPSKFNVAAYANARSWVNIRCGIRDRDNHLWVACERGPLLKLFPETGKVTAINDTSFSTLGIYSMAQDKEGNLWLGTFHHAIIRVDAVTGKFSYIISPPQHPDELDNIFCLFYDGNKYLWAASSKSGLHKINTENNTVEKTYINQPDNNASIPVSQIYTITKTAFNQLMMSTPVGIVVMDIAREKFHVLNTGDGLPDNNPSSLIAADRQHVWFASDNGISVMAPDKMKASSYGVFEGLTDESFNIGAAACLRDGSLLFGHNEGFTSVRPAAFTEQVSPEEVNITGIRLFDRYLNTDSILNKSKGMVLNYHQNFLTIEFSNMSLLAKDHTTYCYQLEGADKEWITASGIPQATYTYLQGGNYTFKVMCKTAGPGKITSFKIKIIPPVWKSWWLYVLAASVFSGITYLFLRSRYRHKLEAEKGRNRIAKDLHDDMGSTLSTINILSEMAKTKIDTDVVTTKKFIHQISDNSNRIMESLDDIVWNIDNANDTIENILSRMREFAGNLLEARDIRYTFKEDERIRHINLELGRRHDFFMIFKEATNNLAKYSDCVTARIEISLEKNTIVLIIADDGKGFEHHLPFAGNGLSNMQQRAASLGGALKIHSEINRGTTVELKMPV